ncbi:hypothetical protein SAMN04488511_10271 [Pedobacter suwonensis]|uniref:Uncharacterized protein n=1 Tax=Pedobacter suwonensis TaxID=332999 RepID=A0A1I0SLM9_9SPHI|nr:hypothetical protein [Pedobacter suwonensis]SFA40431.1 hypothetical protein SAMN04488511_10271 [Pedobacter suwonensis]
MEEEHKNKNLADPKADQTAENSNMPDNQVPRHRSNDSSELEKVKDGAGMLGREMGEGDYGAEEARADPDKGNPGEAGNMPNSTSNNNPKEPA